MTNVNTATAAPKNPADFVLPKDVKVENGKIVDLNRFGWRYSTSALQSLQTNQDASEKAKKEAKEKADADNAYSVFSPVYWVWNRVTDLFSAIGSLFSKIFSCCGSSEEKKPDAAATTQKLETKKG